ncbi:protein of unknown function DUF1126 [Trinorchestia longiramus]|nr:protein of unknown function DUF1126 [Trinorchestia longiramus]
MPDQIVRVRLWGGSRSSSSCVRGTRDSASDLASHLSHRRSSRDPPVTSIVRDRQLQHSIQSWDAAVAPSVPEQTFTLLLYTEDNTVVVLQQPAHNTGSYSGRKVLSRQRVPLPHEPTNHIKPENLQAGCTVQIIGRTYTVQGCDESSYQYLRAQGLNPPPVVSFTSSPPEFQDEADGRLPAPRAWPKHFPLKTYIQNVGKVLRYFGEWVGGTPRLGGVTTILSEKIELRCYLEDGTIEVRCHPQPLRGRTGPLRDHSSRVLRRCLVPKNPHDLSGVSNLGCVDRPVLSLFPTSGRPVMDRCPRVSAPPHFLGPQDFVLGTSVSINGRLLRLVECDAFTTSYCKDVLGIEQIPVSYQYFTEPQGASLHRRIAPLDPPKLEEHPKDPTHPLPTSVTFTTHLSSNKLPAGDEEIVLRFSARLVSDDPNDALRRFVVSVFVHDSTISVYEVSRINSGRRAGMFFARCLVPSEDGRFITPNSLHVGGKVSIFSHLFEIIGADEFTCAYMERSADQFTEANYDVALSAAKSKLHTPSSLTELSRRLTQQDTTLSGALDVSDALHVLSQVLDLLYSQLPGSGEGKLSSQQLSALCRRHRTKQRQPLGSSEFAHLAALYIKKNHASVGDVKLAFLGRDTSASGTVTASEAHAVMRGARLPLPPALTAALVSSWTDETGHVDYKSLTSAIDPDKRSSIHNDLPCSLTEAGFTTAMNRTRDVVMYSSLLQDLGMTRDLLEPLNKKQEAL